MQKFKHIVLPALLTIIVFSSVLYTSCKDKCGSTTCQNGGTCVNNLCQCPTGYYGNSCQSAYSSPFIGTFNCSKSCTPVVSGPATWLSSITVDPTSGGYTVDISDFGGATTITIVATVDSTTADSTAAIHIAPTATSSISGTGSLRIFPDSTIVTLTYTTSGAGGTTCTMRMRKQ